MDVILGNGELWKYNINSFEKTSDTSKTWCVRNFTGNLDSVANAKKKLKVNAPFAYQGEIAEFCLNNNIPLIVIYVDSLTSVWSQDAI